MKSFVAKRKIIPMNSQINHQINHDEILIIPCEVFNPDNVCIIAGCASKIGRTLSIAAAANRMMVLGLDGNEKEGQITQKLARKMGGQMIFIKTHFREDRNIEFAVEEAAKLGHIRFLASTMDLLHQNGIPNFPMKKFDELYSMIVRASFLFTKLVIPKMKESPTGNGTIGYLKSLHEKDDFSNRAAFKITQNALDSLAETIKSEESDQIKAFAILKEKEISDISTQNICQEFKMGNQRFRTRSPLEIANEFILAFSE